MSLRKIALLLLAGQLPTAASEDLFKARKTECEKCPSYRPLLDQCGECGCLLSLKARIVESTCPLQKW